MKENKYLKKELALKADYLIKKFEVRDDGLWRKECYDSKGKYFPSRKVHNVSNCHEGFCEVRLKGFITSYHRIVWTLLKGDVPPDEVIVHMNGDKLDNWIGNLMNIKRPNIKSYYFS